MRGMSFAVLLVAVSAGSAVGQVGDDELARLPRPRPSIAPPAELVAWADAAEDHFRNASIPTDDAMPQNNDDASAAIEAIAPLPRPRPASIESALALVGPQNLPSILVPVEADDPECPERLRVHGATFSEAPPIDGVCSVAHPLIVSALGSDVSIEPEAVMSCRAAESLARWVKEALVPAAQSHFGVAPTTIVHGSTYVCRPRNNVAGAKLSEHAHANAVDIALIKFAERDSVGIGVNDAGSAEEKFENEIRAAACDHFTTVLGPGSDAAHALHLHFDMQKRRGGYRLCELGEPTMVRAPENTKRE